LIPFRGFDARNTHLLLQDEIPFDLDNFLNVRDDNLSLNE
jgi:hypothetical protein